MVSLGGIIFVVGGCTGTCFPVRRTSIAGHERFALLAMQNLGSGLFTTSKHVLEQVYF